MIALERGLTCIREASGLDDFALVAPRLANGCDVTTWCAEALGMHPIQLHVSVWMSFCSPPHAHKTYGGICTCAHAHGCKVGYPLRSMGRLGIKARCPGELKEFGLLPTMLRRGFKPKASTNSLRRHMRI